MATIGPQALQQQAACNSDHIIFRHIPHHEWRHVNKAMRQVLDMLHEGVMPRMADPLLLADFLTRAVKYGGAPAMLALHALYLLMTQHGLEYPGFFQLLYSLMTPSIFQVFPVAIHCQFMSLGPESKDIEIRHVSGMQSGWSSGLHRWFGFASLVPKRCLISRREKMKKAGKPHHILTSGSHLASQNGQGLALNGNQPLCTRVS